MAEKRNAECGDLCFDSESGLWHYSAFQRRASHCPSGNTAVLCGAGALAQAAQRLWGLLGALPKPPARGAGPCSGWLCWGSGTPRCLQPQPCCDCKTEHVALAVAGFSGVAGSRHNSTLLLRLLSGCRCQACSCRLTQPTPHHLHFHAPSPAIGLSGGIALAAGRLTAAGEAAGPHQTKGLDGFFGK